MDLSLIVLGIDSWGVMYSWERKRLYDVCYGPDDDGWYIGQLPILCPENEIGKTNRVGQNQCSWTGDVYPLGGSYLLGVYVIYLFPPAGETYPREKTS